MVKVPFRLSLPEEGWWKVQFLPPSFHLNKCVPNEKLDNCGFIFEFRVLLLLIFPFSTFFSFYLGNTILSVVLSTDFNCLPFSVCHNYSEQSEIYFITDIRLELFVWVIRLIQCLNFLSSTFIFPNSEILVCPEGQLQASIFQFLGNLVNRSLKLFAIFIL